ncbi:MAG TPA: hypothetical protein VFI22_17405, partial [Thermomicrobiales bacterium]|nr:hypothetical protein [Thermomicrobiales bacterium]
MDNRIIRSSLLPGGDLVAAALDRNVMTLADRGGASNIVGERWADVVAESVERWPAAQPALPGRHPLHVRDVLRLDATPQIAATASRHGLQNPDWLLFGAVDGEPALQAADAKFSVETARARQVSPEVVQALLDLRDRVPGFLPQVGEHLRVEPGLFLSPDYPLTHLMLRRRRGITRTTARPDEVVFLPAPPAHFFEPLEGWTIMRPLAAIDALPTDIDASLLTALYYFRLARAAVGFWLDATKPLLPLDDRIAVDEAAIAADAERRGQMASSAWDAIQQWNADVQIVRNARAAVEQVAGMPMGSKELRPLVARLADEAGVEQPPSLNQVRRRLGAWYRRELRQR